MPAYVKISNFAHAHAYIKETVTMWHLSCDVAVIKWITSCHKNRMTTRVITLWRVYITSLTTSVSAMRSLIEKNIHFEGDEIPI